MSSASRTVLEALTSNYLWISNLKRSTDPVQTLHHLQATAAAAATAAANQAIGGGVAAATSTLGVSAPIISGGSSAMMIDPEPASRGTGPSGGTATTEGGGPGAAGGGSMRSGALGFLLKQQQPHSVDSLAHLAIQELAEATITEVQRQVFQAPQSH